MWSTGTPELPVVTPTAGGLLVLVGLCGATREQVVKATRAGVPDDVAWRWPGAYVTVHLEEGQTSIWTDLGALPIYVRQRGTDEVVWSTSARALASLDPALKLDSGAVLGFIQGRPVQHSMFDDVHRLPPGHRVRLRNGGWTATPVWTSRPSPLPTALRLRRALEGAVAVRVDRFERPTCDVSGGLDSTSLALLGARRLAPKSRTITGTTLHPAGVVTGGDLDYAREAASAPGLAHVWLSRGRTHAPYSVLDLPPTDEPPVSAVAFASFASQMRWLAAHGSDLHMTGDGGDALLLTPPSSFTEMIRKRPLRTLRAANRFAQVRRMSLPQALNHGRADGSGMSTGLELPSTTHHTIIGTLIDSARSARADVELAAFLGVRLDNPFFDAQVIDAYLAMPVEEMPEPALYKPLLVQAMRDLLPASLQARTTKATTNADHYAGLRRSLPQVCALFDGYLAAEGLIDVAAVRSRVRVVATGAGDLGEVEPVIAFEVWWRSMKPVVWERVNRSDRD